jgi:hypothetical protein
LGIPVFFSSSCSLSRANFSSFFWESWSAINTRETKSPWECMAQAILSNDTAWVVQLSVIKNPQQISRSHSNNLQYYYTWLSLIKRDGVWVRNTAMNQSGNQKIIITLILFQKDVHLIHYISRKSTYN